ncbi:MAG: bifunctional biotin--[acetyl-CoA-carboxylase] ligase/biotin operon repressor BirA [Candidatus Methylumidiphilus sp.]
MQFHPARKAILKLLADGAFHSGSHIAQTLHCSRASVWSIIHELQQLGLEINAVSGKGYRLARPLELLDAEVIAAQLSAEARPLLTLLDIHDQLDSTNTYLMAQATAGLASGAVCLAEHQTAGRGRVGRVWQSPFAGNICLSVLWRFEEQASVAGLSLSIGVALAHALRRAGIAGLGLKWPNDVLWQARKLGGILLEVSGEAHGRCAVVVGIGLNLHIPPAAAEAIDQDWVDLGQITGGAPPSRNRLVALLLDEVLRLLADYPERGLAGYIEEWRQWHCHAGRAVALHLGGKTIVGTLLGVSDAGLLVLDCGEAGVKEFASGELRLRVL